MCPSHTVSAGASTGFWAVKLQSLCCLHLGPLPPCFPDQQDQESRPREGRDIAKSTQQIRAEQGLELSFLNSQCKDPPLLAEAGLLCPVYSWPSASRAQWRMDLGQRVLGLNLQRHCE